MLALSAEEMIERGVEVGKNLSPGSVLCLIGDLGAGKTTFVKGIAKSLGISEREVSSPTFSYLNIYQGKIPIYHFDLYRLRSAAEFCALGFDEYLQSEKGILCIEWAEKIQHLLPQNALTIKFIHDCENRRKLWVS